jgi:hypothetical protein
MNGLNDIANLLRRATKKFGCNLFGQIFRRLLRSENPLNSSRLNSSSREKEHGNHATIESKLPKKGQTENGGIRYVQW